MMRTSILVLGLAGLAACSQTPKATGTNITSPNTAPVLTEASLQPDPGYETSTLLCTPVGPADADGDDITYTFAWEVNGNDPGATGDSLDGADFDKGDEVLCHITPADAQDSGSTYTSNAVTIANSPPSGISVDVDPTPGTALDTLSALPAGWADADGDAESWRFQWFVNGSTAGTSQSLAGAFVKGDEVYVVATPDDGTDLGTPVQSAVVNIVNSPPTLGSASVGPASPRVGDALTCTAANPDDVDGDPITFIYQWYVNGSPAGSGTDTLTAPAFAAGDDVWCTVIPNDGEDDGAMVTSNIVTIENSAPTIASVALGPDPAYETTTLTCAPAGMTDADGDPITPTFSWTVAGLPIGSTGSQLTGTSFSKGNAVQCFVTASDGVTSSAQRASNVIVIANSPPSATTVGITPTTPYTNDSLTASVVGWSDPDGDPEGYQYQWFKNGLSVPGATLATFPSVNHAKNDILAVQVTPWDGSVGGTPLMSADVVILNSLPSLTTATVTPANPLVSNTLTCTGTGMADGDGDSVTLNYQWYANNVPVGTNSSTLTAPNFDRGDFVKCRITPNDGQDNGNWVESNIVEVFNSVPSVTTVTLAPTSATETSTLTCTASGVTDADGDPVTLYYSWNVAGVPIGETTQTLTGAFFNKGNAVQCFVTPDDGLTFGTTRSSNIVTISNTAPTATSVSITPAAPKTNNDVSASVTGWFDADGDPEGYRYQWFKNGLPVGGATTQSYLSLNFVKGEVLAVEVRPDDGTTLGSVIRSSDVVVLNTKPVLASATVTPANPTVASTLTCGSPAATDLDNDTVTKNYQWYADGVPVGGNTSTLTAPNFANGDDVWCVITPNDGEEDGTAVTSNTVTVANTAPTIASVTLAPSPAYEASTMTCTANGATDADGDSVSLTYAWTVAGVPIAATGSTLTGADFNKGNAVQCFVTPNDGTVDGTQRSSNIITISNTAPSATSVSVGPANLFTNVTATSTVTGWFDADGDAPGYRYQWFVDGGAVPGATTPTLSSLLYTKHQFLSVDVTPDDGTSLGTVISSPLVEVRNSRPVLASATVTPGAPLITDTLTCAAGSATDADTDLVSFTYQWFVDGVAAGTGTTLTAPAFGAGQVVYCEVTPNDGEENGTPAVSNFVSVGNSLPTIASVTLTPNPAYETSTLTCTANGVNDSDGDTVSLTYSWTVDTVPIAATGNTLTGADFDRGQTVQCFVTPNDGNANGNTAASSPRVISNSPPSITSVTITPANPTTSSNLTVTPNGWSDADGDPPGYTYQWFIDGIAVPGETSSSLSSVNTSKGDVVTVQVTPTDGISSGTPVFSSPVTIGNTAPSILGAAITPTSPVESDILTCTPSGWTDADGDAPDYQYSWSVNGTTVPGATNSTLTGADFDKGDSIRCTITPWDGTTAGTPVQSLPVLAVNSPPVIQTIDLSPVNATETSTLFCSATASDLDGDAVTISYSWTVAGAPIPTTGPTLTGLDFNKGQAVRCFATPNDGSIGGAQLGSNTVIIANTPPSATSVTISPSTPTTTQPVTAFPTGWSDVDGDPEGYTYQWYVNGAPAGGNNATLGAANFDKGDQITVNATPYDGTASGTPVVGGPITVINSPPGAPGVSISPAMPDTIDQLTCNVSTGSVDADGDAISYTYRWNRNGVDSGLTGPTVPAASTSLGQVWRCIVTPFDGTATGPTGFAEVTVTDATAPNAPVLNAIPEFQNSTTVNLTGTAEVASTVTLYATCDGGSSGTSQTLAGLGGSFSFVWVMNPGEYCTFYVDAVDAALNVSPPSNTVYTTVCGTPDPYEGGGYGDNSGNPIDEWGLLSEPSSISITGNILPGDPGDWYLIHGDDDPFVNNIQGFNEYNVHIQLTQGVGTYTFRVYAGATTAPFLECSTLTAGYDDYNDYWYDRGDAPNHARPPSPYNQCANGSALYNTCQDMTLDYWVQVIRNPSAPASCANYTLSVSNAN